MCPYHIMSRDSTNPPPCRHPLPPPPGFPFIALSTFVLVTVVSKATGQGADHYSKAGGVANEVIASVRTVASLTAEEMEFKRYSSHLDGAEIAGIKAGE